MSVAADARGGDDAPDAVEALDRTSAYAVVGAGSSGLAAIKNLREHGFEAEGFEREDDVGGNWNFRKQGSRVYANTHMISSKPFTQFPDFPMPDRFPDFPHQRQVLEYFRAYRRHFGLDRAIRFSTEVERVEPWDGGKAWDVAVRRPDGTLQTGRYAGVVVANGHNWNPKLPDYEGLASFAGETMHSADYKDASVLRGKRVLVVGGGNTGCDIVVDAAQQADQAIHSTRRGYWYAPKYIMGRPSDQVGDLLAGLLGSLRLPAAVYRRLGERTLRLTVGDQRRYGLPLPDHHLYETHPIVNSLLLYHLGHGDIAVKPDVARFEPDGVVFADGSRAEVDLVVFATGYLVRFDFLDDEHLSMTGGRPRLHQHVFSPRYDNLFVAGLIQPDSGQFTLAHWQTVAIARSLAARAERPEAFRRFRAEVVALAGNAWSGGTAYKDSTRHWFEVNHVAYARGLERTINLLDGFEGRDG
jgi:cation diffusion facilitator CzcD-associated flavoprotein CzcO